MTILDGKKLSEDLKSSLKKKFQALDKKIRLGIVIVGEDSVSASFVRAKEKYARDIGCTVRMYQYKRDISTNELRKRLADIVHIKRNNGFIVQLPLPEHINTDYILNAILPEKDVDMLSGRSMGDFILGRSQNVPPVVGAVRALLSEYNISLLEKHVAVIGAGRLVGKPVAVWLMNEGIKFTLLTSRSGDISEVTKMADVLITGVGKPRLITADMVKEGTVIIDAGTSENIQLDGNTSVKTVGDVDFDAVSRVASYVTPVPGGVGPLTVAMIFQNLLALVQRKK